MYISRALTPYSGVRRKIYGVALLVAGAIMVGFWAFSPASVLRAPFVRRLSSPVISLPRGEQVIALTKRAGSGGVYPVGRPFITEERAAYGDGELVLKIPDISLELPVLNGTEPQSLKRGIGLYEFSPLPGAGNPNVAIAGYLSDYGRELERVTELKPGAQLVLYYEGIEYTYLLEEISVTRDDNWSAVTCFEDNRLTITAEQLRTDSRLLLVAKTLGQAVT